RGRAFFPPPGRPADNGPAPLRYRLAQEGEFLSASYEGQLFAPLHEPHPDPPCSCLGHHRNCLYTRLSRDVGLPCATGVATFPVATVGDNGVLRKEPPMSALAETQSQASLRGFLHGLPGVDRVGAEARAAMLTSRSIKTTARRWALDTAISMMDLTTLEGQDTPGKVRALCAKARRPDPADPTAPMVAAVCVYPDLAGVAATELRGSGVHVASVATAFP